MTMHSNVQHKLLFSTYKPSSLINAFVPNAPFLYPVKTSENYSFLMLSGSRERVHRGTNELSKQSWISTG